MLVNLASRWREQWSGAIYELIGMHSADDAQLCEADPRNLMMYERPYTAPQSKRYWTARRAALSLSTSIVTGASHCGHFLLDRHEVHQMYGAGNDYIYVNGLRSTLTSLRMQHGVGDQLFGIGSDGLIVILPLPTPISVCACST